MLIAAKVLPPAADPWLSLSPLLQRLPSVSRLALQAPAGYGKTALAAHYHRHFAGPKLWLSLDSGDNHGPRLLAHLALALGMNEPQLRTESEVVVALARHEGGLWVVDQLEQLSGDDSHALLLRLAAHWRGTLVITSRPGGLLPRWLLAEANRWWRWGSSELRLDDAQAQALTNQLRAGLDEGLVTRLNSYFDGWPALWRLWLQQPVAGDDVAHWSGPLRDYLLATWLSSLAPPLRQFISQLAVYDWFDEPLAAAVSDQPFVRHLLAELRQQGMVRLRGSAGQGGRNGDQELLPFLRDALRFDLSLSAPQLLLAAHYRAVEALLARDCWLEAAQQALVAADRGLALATLRRLGWRLYHQAAFNQLRQLFELVGQSHWQTNGELVLLQGWLVVEGERDCARAHRQLEQLLPQLTRQEEWPQLQPRVAVLRAEIAYQFDQPLEALQLTRTVEASQITPHDRIALGYTRAMAALQLGRLDEAEQALTALARAADAEQQHHHSLWVWQRQAVVAAHRLHWPAAVSALQAAEQLATRHGLNADSALDSLWRAKAEQAQLFGDWAAAAQAIARGSEREHPLGDYWELPYRALALVQALAVRDSSRISQLEQQLKQQLAQHSYCQQWQLRARQALLLAAVVRGEQAAIAALAEVLPFVTDDLSLPSLQQSVLAAWCGWHLGRVPEGLAVLAQRAEQAGLRWLSWRLQLVATLAAAPDEPPAAVVLQMQQGYVWDLLLAGPAALPLWERWLTGQLLAGNDAAHDCLLRVIQWCSATPDNSQEAELPSPDPRLTDAEWRVLQLIGRGYRNEQIAARLFIAPSTVKSHINHLYAKLDLHSRSEAKALANQWLGRSAGG
ncbi:MAG: hypothetical protein II007_09795 [Gammaproteobacteria bacterium]|nr:hypothetical protein [Gammaproteobacteria bacterium]